MYMAEKHIQMYTDYVKGRKYKEKYGVSVNTIKS